MRAPGHPQGCFLTEILMDELADRVKMDPVAFRVKNLPPRGAERDVGRLLRARARSSSAGTSAIRPAIRRRGRSRPAWACRRIAGAAPAAARRRTSTSLSDGSVVVKCGTQDIGTGTRTIVAMVAAETFGLPVSAVKAEIGDTLLSVQRRVGRQHDGGVGDAGDSRHVGRGARSAVREGGADARRGAAPSWSPRAAESTSRDNPSKGLAWKDACKLIGTEPISVDGKWQQGLSGSGTSGVQFAEATVDIETGIVKVTRILAIQDCGLVVDKLTAESQALRRRHRGRQLRPVRGSASSIASPARW